MQHQNEIVLKKYSPVQALEEIALPYLRSIHHELGCPLLLMDREQFIALGRPYGIPFLKHS